MEPGLALCTYTRLVDAQARLALALGDGQPEDYDGCEALGCDGWGWDETARCFREIEDHQLGPVMAVAAAARDWDGSDPIREFQLS